MLFKVRDVLRSLRKKGFVEDAAHHKYLYFYYQGRQTQFYTLVSHGSGSEDVGPEIVRKMKRQLGLDSHRQVEQLIECTMSEADYVQALLAGQKLPHPEER